MSGLSGQVSFCAELRKVSWSSPRKGWAGQEGPEQSRGRRSDLSGPGLTQPEPQGQGTWEGAGALNRGVGRPQCCWEGARGWGRCPLCTLWSVWPRPRSWALCHQHRPMHRDRRHPGFCQLHSLNPALTEYLLCRTGSLARAVYLPLPIWPFIRPRCAQGGRGRSSDWSEVTWPGSDRARPGPPLWLALKAALSRGPGFLLQVGDSRVPEGWSPGPARVSGSTGLSFHQVSLTASTPSPPSRGSVPRSLGDVHM